MHIKKHEQALVINGITLEQAEIIQTAVLRIIEDLPTDMQPLFRSLAMEIDKLLKPK